MPSHLPPPPQKAPKMAETAQSSTEAPFPPDHQKWNKASSPQVASGSSGGVSSTVAAMDVDTERVIAMATRWVQDPSGEPIYTSETNIDYGRAAMVQAWVRYPQTKLHHFGRYRSLLAYWPTAPFAGYIIHRIGELPFSRLPMGQVICGASNGGSRWEVGASSCRLPL